jgi:group I intron endonuclease
MGGIVYKITNAKNGKVYIGQTIRPLSHRWTQHLRDFKKKANYPLYRSFRKYGLNNFSVEIIDWANNQDELNYKEWFFITKFESFKPENGYNLKMGGANGKMSEESKDKIREASLNNGFGNWKRTEEHNRKNREKGILQHQNPIKRNNFLIANGSKYFNVYRAVLVTPYKRGPAGGKGVEAIYEKGEYIGEWLDTAKCANELKLKKYSNIARCLRKERKTYQNYIFEHI